MNITLQCIGQSPIWSLGCSLAFPFKPNLIDRQLFNSSGYMRWIIHTNIKKVYRTRIIVYTNMIIIQGNKINNKDIECEIIQISWLLFNIEPFLLGNAIEIIATAKKTRSLVMLIYCILSGTVILFLKLDLHIKNMSKKWK